MSRTEKISLKAFWDVVEQRLTAFSREDFRTILRLPEQDRFMADWIAFLKTREERDADTWLREAVRLYRGVQGLAELARTEGRQRPHAYLDWLTVLEQQSEHHQMLDVAQGALEALPNKLPIRAAVADRLCQAALALGEPGIVRQGRWQAFQARPTLMRLLDLWEAVPEAERPQRMHQATLYVQDYLKHPPGNQELFSSEDEDSLEDFAWLEASNLAHAYLLAGEWDRAHKLTADAEVLGWSGTSNHQGLVVAAFLVALSGKITDVLPANLNKLWEESLTNSIAPSCGN